MEKGHLLGVSAHRCLGSTLYEEVEEFKIVECRLVDGVVLIVALVDLIRPVRGEFIHECVNINMYIHTPKEYI